MQPFGLRGVVVVVGSGYEVTLVKGEALGRYAAEQGHVRGADTVSGGMMLMQNHQSERRSVRQVGSRAYLSNCPEISASVTDPQDASGEALSKDETTT